MSTITASEIKFIRSLGEKKYRAQSGLFIVEGEKLVSEAMASGFTVRSVYRMDEIGEDTMKRISLLSSPSPVLAVVEQRKDTPETDFDALSLALDGIRDPGNLGTILRIADWFGIDTIFCSPGTVELYNPKVVQATMGAIFRKKVVYMDLREVCGMFASRGKRIWGTFLEGSDIYSETLSDSGLIVMGSEADGISDEVGACISDRITIPSFATGQGSESLNVAVATAITLSEFKRRLL